MKQLLPTELFEAIAKSSVKFVVVFNDVILPQSQGSMIVLLGNIQTAKTLCTIRSRGTEEITLVRKLHSKGTRTSSAQLYLI